MTSRFHYASFFHDVYEVCMHCGGKAVSNYDCRATGSQAPEPLEPISFGPGIERAGWFIENDDRCLPQKSSGQRDALPFASAQLYATHKPLSQKAVGLLRQSCDDLVRAGCTYRGFDFAVLG